MLLATEHAVRGMLLMLPCCTKSFLEGCAVCKVSYLLKLIKTHYDAPKENFGDMLERKFLAISTHSSIFDEVCLITSLA